MKLTYILASMLATATNAHSDFNTPKIVGGRRLMSELKARNIPGSPVNAPAAHLEERKIVERQTSNGRCGPGLGSCTNCCSAEGYCGTGLDYCAAPDCQYQYGPQCDANKKPAGTTTANIARPQLGSIPYGGTGIYDCAVPGQVAFTFDDGPYLYTSDLLDKLKAYNAKATFFITGNNLGKGAIDSTAQWANLIKRMVAEGHQIASHTWSHQDLSTLNAATFNNQMVYNEMAFSNILGYFPTYMRPPYSSCDNTCASRLKTLGYHVTYFDLDTAGYLNTRPDQIQNSKNIWDQAISTANPAVDNFLEIEHDIHQQVVYNLTDYILASMYTKGFKSVTVGECLADPKANWYRAGPGGSIPSSVPTSSTPIPTTTSSAPPTSSSSPTTPGQAISVDGSCSATITCQDSTFGNCCSQYGWCGSTIDYCGEGCNPASGTCPNTNPSVPSLPSSSSIVPPVLPTTTTTTTTTTSNPPPIPTTTIQTTTTTRPPTPPTTTTTANPIPTTPALKISTNGSCGGTTGFTCTGSRYGKCCSRAGRCGSLGVGSFQPYCGAGCQVRFGVCN